MLFNHISFIKRQWVETTIYHVLFRFVHSKPQKVPQNALFEQDGGTFHRRCDVHTLLDELFPSYWTRSYGLQNWCERSPDLKPPDFLCRFVKDKISETPVHILSQLKRRIRTAMKSVSQEMMKTFWFKVENRLHGDIRVYDSQIKHLCIKLKLTELSFFFN